MDIKNNLSIILVLIGTTIFMIGVHSIDLAYNTDALYDRTLSGKILDMNTVYSNGLIALYVGLIINMIGVYYANAIKR